MGVFFGCGACGENHLNHKVSYINDLLNKDNCDNIIKSLKMVQPDNDPLFVTLAIDAAKFKSISGIEIKKILQRYLN